MVCTKEFFCKDVRGLIPENGAEYEGWKGSLWFFIVYNTVMTVRSMIHVFAPHGGLTSIAGLDVTGEGGASLINMTSHWGME